MSQDETKASSPIGKYVAPSDYIRGLDAMLQRSTGELRHLQGSRHNSTSTEDWGFSFSAKTNRLSEVQKPKIDVSIAQSGEFSTQYRKRPPRADPVRSSSTGEGGVYLPNCALPPDDPIGQATTTYDLVDLMYHQNRMLYTQNSPHQGVHDQHCIISIALFGWTYARNRLELSPQFNLLEQVYHVFRLENINDVECLFVLDFSWRIVKAQGFGFSDDTVKSTLLPDFHQPTDTERAFPVDLGSQFYPWPGVRSAVVTNPGRYRTDAFAAALTSQLRFRFPSVNAAIQKIPNTETLVFTEEWARARNDLRNYSCTSDFLDWYPELRDSIPVYRQKPDPPLWISVVNQLHHAADD